MGWVLPVTLLNWLLSETGYHIKKYYQFSLGSFKWSPTVTEVQKAVNRLQLKRAAGLDDLPPALFKNGNSDFINLLTNLFEHIWRSESVPLNWGESTVIPIFKKGKKTLCDNHRGISLTPVVTTLLALIILHRLAPAREGYTREQQAGFRPGRGCIDHIFTLRQHLEHRNTFHRSTMGMFLDLEAAFDSVVREALFYCTLTQGVPQKYVSKLSILTLQEEFEFSGN